MYSHKIHLRNNLHFYLVSYFNELNSNDKNIYGIKNMDEEMEALDNK